MRKLTRDKYLVDEEFKKLLYAARTRPHVHAQRDYTALVTCGLTGVRAKELAHLRIEDLSRIEERPAVLRVTRAKKRRFVQEDVGLPVTAALALQKYVRLLPPEERQPWSRVFPLTTRQLGRLFKVYSGLAGLNPRYSIHALRHYRGLKLYAETKDVLLVKESLGHSKLETTMIYVHVVDQFERAASVDIES